MLISVCWATRLITPSEVGMARPATSSGMPAAISELNTRMSTSAAIGSDTVSARVRSSSDRRAESCWIGPKPVSLTSKPVGVAVRRASLTGVTRSMERSSSTSSPISTYALSPLTLMNRGSCVWA